MRLRVALASDLRLALEPGEPAAAVALHQRHGLVDAGALQHVQPVELRLRRRGAVLVVGVADVDRPRPAEHARQRVGPTFSAKAMTESRLKPRM